MKRFEIEQKYQWRAKRKFGTAFRIAVDLAVTVDLVTRGQKSRKEKKPNNSETVRDRWKVSMDSK